MGTTAAADGKLDIAVVWIRIFCLPIILNNHVVVVVVRVSGNVSLDIVWIDKFSQWCRHRCARSSSRRSDNVVAVGSTTDGGVQEEEMNE